MLHRVMTASLQDVIEAYEVTLYVAVGIGDAVTDSCLGNEVDDHINLVFREDLLNESHVGYVTFDECPIFRWTFNLIQPFMFRFTSW